MPSSGDPDLTIGAAFLLSAAECTEAPAPFGAKAPRLSERKLHRQASRSAAAERTVASPSQGSNLPTLQRFMR
jgi:hypothetical protein